MSAEQSWARGSWMQTYTGRQFYPLDPRPDEIDPRDIAHALSMICRYGGHVSEFYSVAEHCVLMSHRVPDEHALWALLHDATEAYVGDMVRPLKHHLPAYQAVEDVVMATIARRFDLRCEWKVLDVGQWHAVGERDVRFVHRRVPVMPAEVKDADNRILLDERAALLSNQPAAWDVDGLQPLDVPIRALTPYEAEHYYLARLDELGVVV